MVDHGQLSTNLTTYGIPILFGIAGYIQLHPELVNDQLGASWGAFVLFLIGILVYNYQNPRANSTTEEDVVPPVD